jgi:periplasmic protein TonB
LLFGQETRKINDKATNETFHVLKSDRTTRHGEYRKFSYNDRLLVKGYYKLGVKDSTWECYDLNGQLTMKFDYTKNELVFYKPNDKVKDKKFKIAAGNNSADTTLSRPPIFLGGDDYILSELANNIRYPANAVENGKSGKVFVIFTVDRSGKTGNYHVATPLGYGMDEEAIRVLKLLPDNWLPGLSAGQPVDVEVAYAVTFTLH